MDFYKFMGAIGGVYVLYYLAVIGYDLYFANKNSENEDKGEDIDISGSLANYVPADAEEIAKKEAGEEDTEEEMVVEEEKERKEENDTNDSIEVNCCGGITPLGLREIFEQETGDSFFRGILPVTT
uniref:hypothetical protein n=1 Tax=Bacteroides fragilis TaxID=817 RepID=UPI0035620A10